MASGATIPIPGDPGPSNRRDGDYTGPGFPDWGDADGNHGKMVVLRMEAAKGELPKDPFLIRKSVEDHLRIKVDSAYPEARGISYVLKMRNRNHVEKLLQMNQLTNGFGIKISEHPVLNYSKCVISCAESTMYSDAEIKQNLKDQGISDVRRITRRGMGDDRINTPTIILTIIGTVVPQHINFGWIRCKTRMFYPSPMLCYACYNFGHTRVRCQQPVPTCGNCSGQHEIMKDVPCTLPTFCKRCKCQDHPLSSRKCPTYTKEEEIQHIRVDMGITYPAAKRAYEQQHGAKSMAAIVSASNDQRFAEITAKLEQVLTDVGRKDAQIDTLMAEIKKRDDEIAKRDERIQKLESILRAPPNDRLEIVKQHGTMNDMVSRVHQLEAELEARNQELTTIKNAKTMTNSEKDTKKQLKKKDATLKRQAEMTTQTELPLPPRAKPIPSTPSQDPPTPDASQQQLEKAPGTKKKIVKQFSNEADPKRVKSCSSPKSIVISDTEIEIDAETSLNETSIDIDISSDDGGTMEEKTSIPMED